MVHAVPVPHNIDMEYYVGHQISLAEQNGNSGVTQTSERTISIPHCFCLVLRQAILLTFVVILFCPAGIIHTPLHKY